MKRLKIVYWLATILVALVFFMSSIQDFLQNPEMVQGMKMLGYPLYFMTILGVAKLLATVALLVPRFPTLKEWAYAGCVFDLTGAFWSHLASNDSAHAMGPIVVLVFVLTSYITFKKIQKIELNSL